MSDTGSTPSHIDASHAQRSKFEQAIYYVATGIVTAFAVVLLFGVAFPPPAPDLKVADWGASIVSRASQAAPVLMVLLGALASWLGISLTRGAHDAKLDCNKE